MRSKIWLSRLLLSAVAVFSSFVSFAQAETLTVYTYESFNAEWGPGPKVKAAFEKECACTLEFIGVTDGVALLNRLKLEQADTKADIVLGLDTNLTEDAKATGLFAPHGMDLSGLVVPGGFTDDIFVPYDFAHFAVVYDSDKGEEPAEKLCRTECGTPRPEDRHRRPAHLDTGAWPGAWVKSIYGDKAADTWTKLAPKVLTVTPGWSEAYSLFTKGEAEMVLSYTTSPAYHMIAENSERYQAAAFEEGHYLQIEVAAKTVTGKDNPLSDKFLAFMVSPAFQDIIPENNWMFPAGKTSTPLNPVFEKMVKPAKTFLYSAEEVSANRKAWIDEWQKALGK